MTPKECTISGQGPSWRFFWESCRRSVKGSVNDFSQVTSCDCICHPLRTPSDHVLAVKVSPHHAMNYSGLRLPSSSQAKTTRSSKGGALLEAMAFHLRTLPSPTPPLVLSPSQVPGLRSNRPSRGFGRHARHGLQLRLGLHGIQNEPCVRPPRARHVHVRPVPLKGRTGKLGSWVGHRWGRHG